MKVKSNFAKYIFIIFIIGIIILVAYKLNEEKKKDKIIIVASHIKEDIDTLADVVYNIDNGIVEKIKG